MPHAVKRVKGLSFRFGQKFERKYFNRRGKSHTCQIFCEMRRFVHQKLQERKNFDSAISKTTHQSNESQYFSTSKSPKTMVLLRSLPEFTTMCINAIELLDAMNCKGSLLGGIDCNDASWFVESRDEVIESQPDDERCIEEDHSSRYGDLIDTPSLSDSVHNLLCDSSRRSGQRSIEENIFRTRRSSQEPPSTSSSFNSLNRCTAWVQDDYSFESEQAREESNMEHESVRIIHWEDRVTDSNFPIQKYGCSIFRPSKATDELCGSSKIHRCSAWSMDDSSRMICDSCGRRQSQQGGDQARVVHWDERVEGAIQ